MSCKYIIFKNKADTLFPVVFSSSIGHSDMAEKVGETVDSAGAASFFPTKDYGVGVSCVRGSITLGIAIDTGDGGKQDAELLKTFLEL